MLSRLILGALPMIENINIYCVEIKIFPQVPAFICVLQEQTPSRDSLNPCLWCRSSQKNKIIPVTPHNVNHMMNL